MMHEGTCFRLVVGSYKNPLLASGHIKDIWASSGTVARHQLLFSPPCPLVSIVALVGNWRHLAEELQRVLKEASTKIIVTTLKLIS